MHSKLFIPVLSKAFFILLALSHKSTCTLLNGMCHWSSVTFMEAEIKLPVCDLCKLLACSTALWGVHLVSNQCAVKRKRDNWHTWELQISVLKLIAGTSFIDCDMCPQTFFTIWVERSRKIFPQWQTVQCSVRQRNLFCYFCHFHTIPGEFLTPLQCSQQS